MYGGLAFGNVMASPNKCTLFKKFSIDIVIEKFRIRKNVFDVSTFGSCVLSELLNCLSFFERHVDNFVAMR